MIGTSLGRYRIVSKLGEGGMGSVWRAEDPALGRTVALKLLSPALARSDEGRQRFIREARAVAKLEHPAIPSVYDIGESDDPPWIAYAFVEGETVAARTAEEPLPLPDVVRLGRDTAEALAHAHSRGVLHRDVTAGNVMVTRDGRAMLIDFGLARPEGATQLTRTRSMMGTSGYVAPEVLRGGTAGARSDLYSFGAVLYRMVTGRLPFEDANPEAVFYRALNEPAPPPSDHRPDTPAALERVILRLLERDPAQRYASASEVAEALREVSPAQAPGRAERARRALARRWRRSIDALRRIGRRRVGLAAVGSAVLLVVALWSAAKLGWLPGTAVGPQVLGVLPFENTSAGNEDAGYIGGALGQELVARLGDSGAYRTLSWSTTRRFSNSQRPLADIARDLHATALVVGSYRLEGDQLHVTASLVDGRSGVQQWSRALDGLPTDIMSIQSSIALGVAARMEGSIPASERGALERRPTSNPEAYEYYLRGANYFQSNDETEHSLAEPHFAKAIELDPNLAEGHVGLGALYVDGYFRGGPGGRELLRKARAEFTKALSIRPHLPRAERGLISVNYETGHVEDMLQLAAAVADRGDKDVDGLLARGWALMLSGLPEDAIPVLERVLELDPLNAEAAWFRAVSLAWSGKYAACIESGRQYAAHFGEDPEVVTWMALSSFRLGNLPAAVTLIGRALELFGDDQSNMYAAPAAAMIYHAAGDQPRLTALLEHWLPLAETRRTAAPDNDRVVLMEATLLARAGQKRAAAALVDTLIGLAKLEPGGFGLVRGAALGPATLTGDSNVIARTMVAMRLGNLEVAHVLFHLPPQIAPDELRPVLEGTDEGRAFGRDVRARLATLRARYLPRVGLRSPGQRCGGRP